MVGINSKSTVFLLKPFHSIQSRIKSSGLNLSIRSYSLDKILFCQFVFNMLLYFSLNDCSTKNSVTSRNPNLGTRSRNTSVTPFSVSTTDRRGLGVVVTTG